ncbi:MAG TPA: CHASE2 domain-containing protein, partial [Methylomirabilota bacterium]|nr:CHASE2 domain-containing protein [Methylomirabilota bacterium]
MLPATVIALAATLVAGAISALGGPRVTALEWSAYDRWLRGREGAPSRPPLVVVVRDPASEARFGRDGWDRALLARVITNLARAGAGVIGVDVGLATPGVGGRGGPAADALLSEATAMAGNVVYPVPPAPPVPPLAQRARGGGHILTAPDADGVVRKVPLFVSRDGAAVPAFGLALAAALRGTDADRPPVDGVGTREPGAARSGPVQIPVDRHGPSLVGFSGSGFPRGTTVVPFSEVWTAIEERRLETLQRLVEDNLVLVAA